MSGGAYVTRQCLQVARAESPRATGPEGNFSQIVGCGFFICIEQGCCYDVEKSIKK